MAHIRHFLVVLVLFVTIASNAAEPYGKFGEKNAALSGPGGALRPFVGNEADAAFGGRFRYFRHGLIYWRPEIGKAFAGWGAVGDKWSKLGRVAHGCSITDERATLPLRAFQHLTGLKPASATAISCAATTQIRPTRDQWLDERFRR